MNPSALRVGDTRVSRDDIESDLKGYEKALLAGTSTAEEKAQVQAQLRKGDAFSPDFTVAVLNRRVGAIALDTAFAATGAKTVTITAELRKRAEQAFAGQNAPPESGQKAFAALSKKLQDRELRLVSLPAVLAEKKAKTLGTPEEFYKANPGRFVLEACTRHILIPDKARVDAVRAKIVAGADFAGLAKTESTDTGSGAQGGDLGCGDPKQFVPEFAKAVGTLKIGELSKPVQTQFGYHLIEVKSRKIAPFAQVKSAIGDDMLAKAREDVESEVAVYAKDLSVDPLFGVAGTDQQGRPAVLVTPTAASGGSANVAPAQG